jgi:uncharacterized protein
MSSKTERTAGSILTGRDGELDVESVDTSEFKTIGELQGRVGFVCTPEDDRSVARVGIFDCEPCTLVSPVEAEHTYFLLEGEVRIELDDSSAVDLRAGDIAMVPKCDQARFIYKTRVKEFFVVSPPPPS